MVRKMTRNEAMVLLNVKKKYQLADRLHLTTSAIAQWGDNDIPDYREYEVRELAAGRTPPRIAKLRKSNPNLAQVNA